MSLSCPFPARNAHPLLGAALIRAVAAATVGGVVVATAAGTEMNGGDDGVRWWWCDAAGARVGANEGETTGEGTEEGTAACSVGEVPVGREALPVAPFALVLLGAGAGVTRSAPKYPRFARSKSVCNASATARNEAIMSASMATA